MMWTARPLTQMSADEHFIHQVRLTASKYNVEVEVDAKNRVVNLLTCDEVIKNTIVQELEEIFQ